MVLASVWGKAQGGALRPNNCEFPLTGDRQSLAHVSAWGQRRCPEPAKGASLGTRNNKRRQTGHAKGGFPEFGGTRGAWLSAAKRATRALERVPGSVVPAYPRPRRLRPLARPG